MTMVAQPLNTVRRLSAIAMAAGFCLCWLGCSTADVNPAAPRAHRGYIDFYTDEPEDLCWRVREQKDPAGALKVLCCDYDPIEGNILRLAVPAGTHRLEVWFNNRVTTGPQTVQVEAAEAKVTPVHVMLTSMGDAAVEQKYQEYRPTARASRTVNRRVSTQQQNYRIGLSAGAPQTYHPKQQMPYWAPAPK
jgi:hypothetical protein